MRLVAAPDSFRGTVSAAQAAGAVTAAADEVGWRGDAVPLADGGEGFLDVLGGANRSTVVTGPLGQPVDAPWRLGRGTAVIEMARAAGLELAGGAAGNDPVAATTRGVGELIGAALDAGARRVLVGMGGSATTDGGLGALRALQSLPRLAAVELVAACDVRTRFLDAAEVFAPQKGASPAQVKLLRRRLQRLAQVYREEHGVEVTELDGAGAAGGLAGGLAAAGASLVSGFDVVAEEVELWEHLEGADLVVTGEGFCDAQSFDGKVVGGVAEAAAAMEVPVLVVAGQLFDGVSQRTADRSGADSAGVGHTTFVSLVERFGAERAREATTLCIHEVVAEHLRRIDG